MEERNNKSDSSKLVDRYFSVTKISNSNDNNNEGSSGINNNDGDEDRVKKMDKQYRK